MALISDLPNSLVEEILSRLPLKSMRAVRLTCKEWGTLSKSPSFAKMHIDKLSAAREGESMVIATMDNTLYLKEDPFNGKYVCLDKQIKISQVYHCDGLLLCVLGEDYTKVIVWNPYWGQTRSVETRCYHSPCGCDRFSYALGYEDKKSCRSYKILRFVDEYYENAPGDQQQFVLYEIYDFDSGLWRILDVTPHWRISFDQGTLSLKGNTYWPALHRDSVQGLSDDHIICFDFTSETFEPLIPLPFGRIHDGYVTLSCVREEEEEEEKLGVLLSWPYLEFGTWVTGKIEAGKVSWSENFSVDTIPYHPLLLEEKEVTTSFEDDRFILDDTEDTYCSARIGSYVPSLAQIKQPAAGCKRKQQCDLETQEYDQNGLTLEKRSKECKR